MTDYLKELLEGKLKLHELDSLLSKAEAAQLRIQFLNAKTSKALKHVTHNTLEADKVVGKNIENFVGAIHIPLGIVGPLKVNGEFSKGEFYVPLATTEGALLATVNRGCSIATKSGGVTVRITKNGMTRAPVFKCKDLDHSIKTVKWVEENFKLIKKEAESTTKFGELLEIKPYLNGRNVYLRFRYDTKDAMGMNMATIACDAANKLIEAKTGAKCISVSGNMCTDKKPSAMNLIEGRGKSTIAEVTLKREFVEKTLKTTPEAIIDINYRKNLIGSAMAGLMSHNSHVANMVAAAFAATGQDLAQVVDSSLAIVSAELTDEKDLYFSLYLPALEVGTVGGGTNLPTQKECLELLDCHGAGKPPGTNSKKLAEIIAAVTLCGELSTLAAQSAGHLASAHKKMGR